MNYDDIIHDFLKGVKRSITKKECYFKKIEIYIKLFFKRKIMFQAHF